MPRLHLFRERQAGEAVAARAAAGDEHPHRCTPDAPPLTDNRTPAASRDATALLIP